MLYLLENKSGGFWAEYYSQLCYRRPAFVKVLVTTQPILYNSWESAKALSQKIAFVSTMWK